jgi:hypothetical protein
MYPRSVFDHAEMSWWLLYALMTAIGIAIVLAFLRH